MINGEEAPKVSDHQPPIPKKLLPLDIGVDPELIKNPYSGEKVWLQPNAVAVYDLIKGAEITADPNNGDHPNWQLVRDGLDWFRKHYAKEYMVLLD